MASNVKLNLIQLAVPPADLPDIDAAITTLETKLLPHLIALTAEQRSNFFKMGTREQIVRDAVTAASQNPGDIPTNMGTADAEADLTALDAHRPRFARITKIAQACNDSEMALGIDLINFALRVYGILSISAPAALKDLLERMGAFFSRGPRAAATPPAGGGATPTP
jgi:hypothetical protein